MAEGVVAALAILFTLLYAGLLAFYRWHWRALPEMTVPAEFVPGVQISVIIAARNEAGQIQKCLNSLLQQDYPKNLTEWLLVDDHSEDGTAALARKISDPRLRVLELKDAPPTAEGKPRTMKKRALEWGIAHAHGELILTTDADCEVPRNWMREMAYAFQEKGWHCVAGPVEFKEGKNLLQRFQALDFAGMMLLTGAGFHAGAVQLANGASFGFSKKAFVAVGGYADNIHIASGDDLFLLHKIMPNFPVGFMKTPIAVRTEAPATVVDFIRQRLRWGTKSSAYRNWQVKAALAIAFFHCWGILLCIPGLMLQPAFFGVLFLLQISIKSLSDYYLLRMACTFFHKKPLLSIFWPAQVLHILYIAVVGLGSNLLRHYIWKGRRVR